MTYNQIKKEFNIDFKEIYAVIILYYSTFSINENKYIPQSDISEKHKNLFNPQRKKAIENIYSFKKKKNNYIAFNDFSMEENSEENIITAHYDYLSKYYKDVVKQNRYKNIIIYNEMEARVFALFKERRYTFNKLAKKVFEYLEKYLDWYELSNGDVSKFKDLLQDKNKIEDAFKEWFKKQDFPINYNEVLYGLESAKNLIKIDILGNLNKKTLLMAQDYFNLFSQIKYLFNLNKFNKIKKSYYIYLDFLDSKDYILNLANLDFTSKEELDKDFRETFNSFFKKGIYCEENNYIPGKFIQ